MDGMAAMHGAALTGSNEVIRYLVEHGADLNIATKIGQVPLSVAMGVYPTVSRGTLPLVIRIWQSDRCLN
jgi:hypothetical protein